MVDLCVVDSPREKVSSVDFCVVEKEVLDDSSDCVLKDAVSKGEVILSVLPVSVEPVPVVDKGVVDDVLLAVESFSVIDDENNSSVVL